MEDYKQIVLEQSEKYLSLVVPDFRIESNSVGRYFTCPSCGHVKALFVKNKNKDIRCLHERKSLGNILTIYRDGSEKNTIKKIATQLEIPLDIMSDEDVERILNIYMKNGFDMVPVVGNDKIPAEKDWVNKNHKDVKEWKQWLSDGMNIGVKTGKVSNVTIIDIDQKPLPIEIESLISSTCIMQESSKGYHLMYQYESDLPKTRIPEYKIDIENDKGQVVVFPSRVNGQERKFYDHTPDGTVTKMPEKLKEFLKNNLSKAIRRESDSLDVISADFNIESVDAPEIPDGSRHHFFMRIGGILRKMLSENQTRSVLEIMNKTLCNPPLDPREFNNIVSSLDRYTEQDVRDLAKQIYRYLSVIEDGTVRDVLEGLNFNKDKKAKIEEALKYLEKEGYVYKKSRAYHVIKKAMWQEAWLSDGKLVDFKMPYFDNVAHFRDGDMIIIGAKTGVGKCHRKGTGIIMSDGSIKKVEDIKANDKVMGIDSLPRLVKQTGIGRDTMYEIIPNKGESFVVNSEHILSLKKTGTYETVNISVKDFLNKHKTFQYLHKLYRVPVEFKEKSLELEPYYLGLWLGDGDKTNPRITNTDKEVIDYLRQYASRLNLQLTEYKNENRCSSYCISNDPNNGNNRNRFSIKYILNKLNLINNKHIPFDYKTSSRQQRLELLAGLIDSDGTLTGINSNTYEISSVNKELSEQILYVIRSLGFLGYIKERKSITNFSNGKECLSYRIRIIGDIKQIPVKIKRKEARTRKINKDCLLTGFKIKELQEEQYYGFELDDDHLYMIDSFIVNHNTHIAMNIIKRLVDQAKSNVHYISLESGSRFVTAAKQLQLKEGDFKYCIHFSPEDIELEPNAITIIDWLLPNDYASTDKLYKHFAEQLVKQKGILIIFVQLKEGKDHEGEFFAESMIKMFPALVVKYLYTKNSEGEEDGVTGKFVTVKIRESKGKKFNTIPTVYDFETKLLRTVEEIENQDKENRGDCPL